MLSALKSGIGGSLVLGLVLSADVSIGQHAHHNTSAAEMTTRASGTVTSATAATADLPTAHFRETHKEELGHLAHVEKWNLEIRSQAADEQKATAGRILSFFRTRLIPHAEWEEAHLYSLIDKLVKTDKGRYTDTMRHEHKIVLRWTEELEAEAAKEKPDYNRFAQKSDMLTGLVRAHFELEDDVLLPHVDSTMSREDFEKAVGEH